MTFLRKWIPRIYMLSTFFWAIGYLIWKYSKTTVIEETTTTLPIPILLLLGVLIGIVTIGGFVIMLLTWWEQIKKDKISFYTFAPISVLMLGSIVLAKLGLHKLQVLIEINVQQFLSDISVYNGSLNVLLLILGSGFIVGLLGVIWEYIETKLQP